MRRPHLIVALLAAVLAVVATFSLAAAAPAELVVLLASTSDNLPGPLLPAPNAPCAESLKALKAAGLKIIDVKGGTVLAFTLQREAALARPAAIAVVYCGPAPEAGSDPTK